MKLFTSSLSRLLLAPAQLSVLALASLCAIGVVPSLSLAQVPHEAGPQARITEEISNAQRVQLKESVHPSAQARFDAGRMEGRTQLHGVSLTFRRSAQQQADLEKLIADQQNPASPEYHKWLTPEQFATRFGMAQADLDKASLWLEQQGFHVERTTRSRDRVFFSGTVDQIECAFSTQIHYYKVDGEKNFAPSMALSMPAALARVVINVGNLDSFRPKPMHTQTRTVNPDFTSSTSGHNFLSPQDVATIYNVHPLWSGGYTGKGQAVAIAGQTYVDVADMEHFQLASGWSSPKDPTLVLIPGSGADGIFSKGDETESDLDLEWSGTIAPDADIFFVYAGAGGNYGVFDAVAYAVDERVAPIVSLSYGACELSIGSASSVASLESIFQKAAVQGQTLVAASGDDGASGCYRNTSLDLASRAALSAGYPASSPYFTAVGGTQFNEGSGTYWQTASGSDVISSALSYIPEVAWNEDSANSGLGSTGGGVSTFFTKPTWQTGVPGIPADGFRDVPDISLPSAGGHDGLLFCSSDTYSWGQGQQASCSKGFRDAASGLLSVSGGTSFATPIFAGMLALINQQQNSTGLGLVNPKLYSLASDPAVYSSAFHDITGGDNRCNVADTTLCPNGATGYDAGTGYDLATGLGSIDVTNLAAAWGSSTLAPTTVTITPSITSPGNGSKVSFTVKVNDVSGSGTPTGTVSVEVDGSAISPDLTLASGTASFTETLGGEGNHIIVATYAGDSTYAVSTKTLSLVVPRSTTTSVFTKTSKALVGTTVDFYFSVQDTASSGNINGTLSLMVDGTAATSLPVTNGVVGTYSTSFSTLGVHTVQAVYSGSPDFATSTGVITVNVVPVQVATTIAIATGATTPVVGTQTPFTVTIKPASGTTAPDGTVSVSIAGTALAPITLANGSANFNYTFSHAGNYLVQAVYSGATAFVASTGTLKLTVSSVAPTASVTSISASSATPALGVGDTFTFTVASGSTGSTAIPTGTIAIAVDGVAIASPLSLTAGTATYTTSFSTAGKHTVSATYSGDGVYTASSASSTVTVTPGSFTLSATSVSLAKGGSGNSTITLTPANGYAGTVAFTVKSPATGGAGLCLGGIPNAVVSGAGAITATLSVRDGQGSCPAAAAVAAATKPSPTGPGLPLPMESVFAAGLLGLGLSVRRWRKLGIYVVMLAALGAGLTLTGCGGSSAKTSSPTTVTFTVTGTDTTTSSITAQTTVNVTLTK